MPAALMELGGNPGISRTAMYQVESIGIDPSNANVVFVAAGSGGNGYLLKSSDGGATFEMSDLSVVMAGNGDEYRTAGERIAVKPDDGEIVLFGSRTAGLWRSTNGGMTWTQVPASSLPGGVAVEGKSPGVINVTFDPANPSRVYASVAGVGIYRSDDAGLSWQSILGGGQWAVELEVSQGVLYATNPKGGLGVRKYTAAGGWQNVTPLGNTSAGEIAVDPRDPNRVYAATDDGFGHFYRSTNGGNSWVELGTNRGDGQANFRAAAIPWKENTSVRDWLSVGALTFDPRRPSRMWFAEGMGVWRSDDIGDANDAPVFNDVSQGIEEMVANDVIATDSGRVVTATWDRAGFVHSNLSAFPTGQIGLTRDFTSGWALTTSPSDPGYVGALLTDHRFCCGDGVYSGYSRDGGASWTRFAANASGVNSPQSLMFGELVVSATDTQNLLWLPRQVDGLPIYYTTDGGASWEQSAYTGSDWNAYFFGSRRRLAADGALAGTFYVNDWTNGSISVSTDLGASFTDAGGRVPASTYWSQLKGVPGRAGHLWFVTGRDHSASDGGLYRSTDGGESFGKDPFFDTAWALGYGKAAATGGYPTIFVFGRSVAGEFGLYRSTNEGATWTKLVDYPLGIFDSVMTVSGDPSIFGRVYIGWSGNSFAYGTPRP